MSQSESEQERATGETHHVAPKHELVASEHALTLHADSSMIAIDHDTETATIQFFTNHYIPEIRENAPWGMKQVSHDLVAEIKIPIPVMNVLVMYYIWVMSNGLDALPLIQEYLRKHPKEFHGVSYGPTRLTVSERRPSEGHLK